MTVQKDFKRRVRARMQKTGESYTTARSQLLKRPRASTSASPTTAARTEGRATKPDYASLAGMSDEALNAKTGCTWEKWVKSLDHYGAEKLSHREIARLIATKFKVGSWWSQTVAVGYERIKGLRARGQQRNGTFGATKSKSIAVPISTLYEAWADPKIRRRWLGSGSTVRSATANRSVRLLLEDGSIVVADFVAKGVAKSQVALEESKLPSRERAAEVKALWEERLGRLQRLLASQ